MCFLYIDIQQYHHTGTLVWYNGFDICILYSDQCAQNLCIWEEDECMLLRQKLGLCLASLQTFWVMAKNYHESHHNQIYMGNTICFAISIHPIVETCFKTKVKVKPGNEDWQSINRSNWYLDGTFDIRQYWQNTRPLIPVATQFADKKQENQCYTSTSTIEMSNKI